MSRVAVNTSGQTAISSCNRACLPPMINPRARCTWGYIVRTNWAGNITYQAASLARPESLTQAQEIVAAAPRVRALGSRHSFNAIADSDGTQVSLDRLDREITLDPARSRVSVDGGIRYGDLAPVLHAKGLALANLASLPHISVAGAVATATHGSGSMTGNLATAVCEMDVITASGDIVTLSRDADPQTFAGAVVSLGALGLVARLALAVEPTYEVAQTVHTGLSHTGLAGDFDEIFRAGTSVSVFTDWQGDTVNAVWVKDRIGGQNTPGRPDLPGTPASQPMHPLPGGRAEDCTEQMGQPGPWHDRLPHFRMDFSPSHGAEIQAEYFMPREEAPRAIAAMQRHGDRLAPLLMISEIRTIAADDLWLSPGQRGPYFAIHFTFRRDWETLKTILPAIEADLAPLGALPHWGKVTTMAPGVIRAGYPRMGDFRDLARDLDPTGKFRNGFLDRMVFAA